MIEVANLTKRFGRVTAVEDLSFTLARGEALALWGPNGAGKTTVIRCLLGLLRCEGRMTILGRDVRRAGKACRRAIGYVPQELAFHGDFRLMEALHFFARLKRAPASRPDRVLDEAGLTAHRRKRIAELSGGMKQRLALAIALLADPPVLALDELTANLDRAARAGFLAMLLEQKRRGRTILFASHRIDEIDLLADRVLGLEDGRKAFECAPPALAGAANLRCTLRLRVDDDDVEAATAALRRRRYRVSSNGQGLQVDVPATGKAGPIAALAEARIPVRDFEMTGDASLPETGASDA